MGGREKVETRTEQKIPKRCLFSNSKIATWKNLVFFHLKPMPTIIPNTTHIHTHTHTRTHACMHTYTPLCVVIHTVTVTRVPC